MTNLVTSSNFYMFNTKSKDIAWTIPVFTRNNLPKYPPSLPKFKNGDVVKDLSGRAGIVLRGNRDDVKYSKGFIVTWKRNDGYVANSWESELTPVSITEEDVL